MKKLIDYLSAARRIDNQVLLEKDVILHQVLLALVQDEFFRRSFAFKGGTCLTKCYLGYYRFSEDLDFTWRDQKLFSGKSQKAIRKMLSLYLDRIFQLLLTLSPQLHLDFKADKSNKRYVELGGSNKFSTFKLWYRSEILQREQFLKIQINFLELFCYPFRKGEAHSIIAGIDEAEFSFLFPEEAVALRAIPDVTCYSLPEIFLEKCRAVLTRREVKARDFIDLFQIVHRENLVLSQFRKEIMAKTQFMLRYDKYIQNLAAVQMEKLVLGEEAKLVLTKLPAGFAPFVRELSTFMLEVKEELLRNQERNLVFSKKA